MKFKGSKARCLRSSFLMTRSPMTIHKIPNLVQPPQNLNISQDHLYQGKPRQKSHLIYLLLNIQYIQILVCSTSSSRMRDQCQCCCVCFEWTHSANLNQICMKPMLGRWYLTCQPHLYYYYIVPLVLPRSINVCYYTRTFTIWYVASLVTKKQHSHKLQVCPIRWSHFFSSTTTRSIGITLGGPSLNKKPPVVPLLCSLTDVSNTKYGHWLRLLRCAQVIYDCHIKAFIITQISKYLCKVHLSLSEISEVFNSDK